MLIWFLVFTGAILAYRFVSEMKIASEYKYITFSEFMDGVTQIAQVKIKGGEVQGIFKNGQKFRTYIPEDFEVIKVLRENGVKVEIVPKEQGSFLRDILIAWIPVIFLILLFSLMIRGMERGNMRAFNFTRSKAKIYKPTDENKVTFDDIADLEEVKEEVRDIIEFLKNPEKFKKMGLRIPKGVIFIGPPGSGKTLLARAIASEAGVPFFSEVGSSFVELFVGVGAGRVRDLFERARRAAPCIIFIDEIDAIGRMRGAGIGGGHDEREQTLNQLLVELDGIESRGEPIVVIAATNRPDILDPALLRPGRFDRKVYFPLPDLKGRIEILKVHLRKKKVKGEIDLEKIAKSIPGFSGADIENLVNEAAVFAIRAGRDAITEEDLLKARDKIIMGVERKGIWIDPEQKKRIAYHEAGHTLVAKIEGPDPVEKVTIIPRGRALGSTVQIPRDDMYVMSQEYLIKKITVLLGGRASEEIVFGDVSTGAADDLQKSTELARKMVCDWGMSSLGPIAFRTREEHIFLGKEITRYDEISEETARKIDEEVSKIVKMCYDRAKKIISENIQKLHKLAKELMEKETLTEKEIDLILNSA